MVSVGSCRGMVLCFVGNVYCIGWCCYWFLIFGGIFLFVCCYVSFCVVFWCYGRCCVYCLIFVFFFFDGWLCGILEILVKILLIFDLCFVG